MREPEPRTLAARPSFRDLMTAAAWNPMIRACLDLRVSQIAGRGWSIEVPRQPGCARDIGESRIVISRMYRPDERWPGYAEWMRELATQLLMNGTVALGLLRPERPWLLDTASVLPIPRCPSDPGGPEIIGLLDYGPDQAAWRVTTAGIPVQSIGRPRHVYQEGSFAYLSFEPAEDSLFALSPVEKAINQHPDDVLEAFGLTAAELTGSADPGETPGPAWLSERLTWIAEKVMPLFIGPHLRWRWAEPGMHEDLARISALGRMETALPGPDAP